MSKLSLFIEIANIFLTLNQSKFKEYDSTIEINKQEFQFRYSRILDVYFIHKIGGFTIVYDNKIIISNDLGEILVDIKINRHDYKITDDESQFILENGRVDLSDIDESYLEQILNNIRPVIDKLNNLIGE